ncbi:MAG: 1-hydroxycarotenoid 3,4-desaturase CrtD [Bacteroidota bacterium]
MRIGIIGAGIAGLGAAIRLQAKGHEVEVFEANAYPGGKLAEIQVGNYRFDAGPSLFTMPHFIEELFSLSEIDIEAYFSYEKLDAVCHYFWEDGKRLKSYSDPQKFAEEVEAQLEVPKSVLLNSLADSRHKFEVTEEIFLHQSLHRARNFLSSKVVRGILNMPRLHIFQTMHDWNVKHLKEPHLVQLFDRFATYNGSSPYQASAIMHSIPHLEHGIGAFFPHGGMVNIPRALHRLAEAKGVRFHFEAPVQRIKVENGIATGFETESGTQTFDRVVSNMDVNFTYRKLMPDQAAPEKTLAQEKSTSALILYWGIKREFPELGVHNIFFTEDYKTEFEHLRKGSVYHDPTVYIHISSKVEKTDAPTGCENWFTMINVPYNSGQDWDAIIQNSRKQIIEKLSRLLETDIEPLIEGEAILDPRSIESRTWSHLGALYGTSSNNRNAAFLRHPNFSRRIKNLYFCGGSVHPGGGIPLALLSGKIVANELR